MSMERVEKLLTLILLNDMKNLGLAEKAATLNKVGLQNSEIAALLGTSPASIGQMLYELRNRHGKKKAKRKSK